MEGKQRGSEAARLLSSCAACRQARIQRQLYLHGWALTAQTDPLALHAELFLDISQEVSKVNVEKVARLKQKEKSRRSP